MKIRSLLKSESPILSSTVFFTGIVVSAGALYEHQTYPAMVTLHQVNLIIGLTFFAGLISIHFTAKSIKQTVVYLEHKKEQDHKQQKATDPENQLTLVTIGEILRGGRDVSQSLIIELSRQLQGGQAALYVVNGNTLELKCGYALTDDNAKYTYQSGEGLIGRVAKEGKSLYIDKLPEGYVTIFSGLGSSSPTYLAIIPLRSENETKGVLEIALFRPLTGSTLIQLENIGKTWVETGL